MPYLPRAGVPAFVDRWRIPRRRVTKPDPSLLDDVVASKVLAAMKAASIALTALGIRHVVVGGLAEAFEHRPGGFVMLKRGVPIQVNGVAIALRSVQPGEEHLAAALKAPMGSSMIDAPRLVYLKLKSPRQRDRVDVIELIKAGIDLDACRTYLARHAPTLVAMFEDSVVKAAAEE